MGRGWFPGKTRALLSQLDTVLARTEDAASGLIRAGVREGAIQVSGSLEETGGVLNWNEDTRYELAQKIGPRPIWFAGCIDEVEANYVAAAHRQASLRAHRLLCIVTPHGDSSKVAEGFRDQCLNVTLEADGNQLDESTQIFIAEGADNHGLWTRLAPITFIGGSHTTGARLDPFHVATVGSVVVHGHEKGVYSAHFDRLMNAKATFVNDKFDGLGPAISHLLSADKAAQYAQTGWEVTSSGAEVVNILAQKLLELTSTGGDNR
jgi:3-deoxy-D-manno-octulosonic-acid transferase